MTERNPDAGRGEDSDPEPGSGTTGSGETEGPEPHSFKKPRTETGSEPGAGPVPASGRPVGSRPESASESGPEDGPEHSAGDDPEGRGPGEGPGLPEDAPPPQDPVRREPALPVDEDAAWAAIVAGYGKEPDDPVADPDDDSGRHPGADHDPDGDTDPRSGSGPDGATLTRPQPGPGESGGHGDGGSTPVHSFTVYSAGTGPRDWDPENDDDEGHFVPPEPPPLPETDPTTRFAWLAAVGGPLLLFFCILTQIDMTWWIYTLGIGGFLGGFATLVARMRDGTDDDEDDPGRGAVV